MLWSTTSSSTPWFCAEPLTQLRTITVTSKTYGPRLAGEARTLAPAVYRLSGVLPVRVLVFQAVAMADAEKLLGSTGSDETDMTSSARSMSAGP